VHRIDLVSTFTRVTIFTTEPTVSEEKEMAYTVPACGECGYKSHSMSLRCPNMCLV